MSFLRTWSYYIDIWLFDRESYIFFFFYFLETSIETFKCNLPQNSIMKKLQFVLKKYIESLLKSNAIQMFIWEYFFPIQTFTEGEIEPKGVSYQNWIMFWKTSHTFQSFLCWCQFSHIDSRLECRMPLMTNYQAKYMCVCENSKTFLKREKVIFFLNKMRATRKPNLMSLSIKSHFFCPY